MDRSSIASTALVTDQASEFYDTPPARHSCNCCAPPNCPCCVGGTGSTGAAQHHHHHAHATQNPHSHYQSPASLGAHSHIHSDPMENYDVPPLHPHGGITAAQAKELHGVPQVARSVNGEGKMPLVSAAAANAHAIYAQVDKTKKTQRQMAIQQQHFVNCDNSHQSQPIYENHGNPHCQQQQQPVMQPTYANIESPTPKAHNGHQKGKPPAPIPTANSQVPPCPAKQNPQNLANKHCAASNYVNLEYASGSLLYENTQDVRQEPVMSNKAPVTTPSVAGVEKVNSDLVSVPPQVTPHNAGAAPTTSEPVSNDETKKDADDLKTIPEEKEGVKQTEIKENEYENTSAIINSTYAEITENKQGESGDSVPLTKIPEASSSSRENGNEEQNLPLRRSSSVPCKGGHANRGSASSSDSGVSGDGGLFFDDSSPLNDIGR